MIATLNGAPFKWVSKATSVTFASPKIGEGHADVSSGAAEVYAAGNAILDIVAMSHVIDEMGIEFPEPFVLEMDNEAARIFCMGSAQKTKLKHIDFRQEWVQTLRNRGMMTPQHVDSAENLADILTKILGPQVFQVLRAMCMARKLIPN